MLVKFGFDEKSKNEKHQSVTYSTPNEQQIPYKILGDVTQAPICYV